MDIAMHIIIMKFGPAKSQAPQHMEGHKAWLDEGVASGVFHCVGSLDVGGGFILAHGEQTEALKERVAADPFVQHNVVVVEMHHVDVNRTSPELGFLKA